MIVRIIGRLFICSLLASSLTITTWSAEKSDKGRLGHIKENTRDMAKKGAKLGKFPEHVGKAFVMDGKDANKKGNVIKGTGKQALGYAAKGTGKVISGVGSVAGGAVGVAKGTFHAAKRKPPQQ